jgi:1-acyl-sn-glycerol-3-phosphate acyltransferase
MMDAVVPILSKIAFYLWRAFWVYASTVFIFPLFSVYQEHKIWAPPGLPSLSLWGHVKVYLFNVFWMGFCLLSTLLLLIPKRILSQKNVQYESFMWCERWIAVFMVKTLVGNVEIRGQDNLPPLDPASPAPIYIANHESQLDLGVVYFLHRRWKWISKKSVLFLPGVGSIMYLSGHVFIDRKTGKNKTSVANLYDKSNAAVQSGIPMFFFPQGTRKISERLPFKDGAFNVALQNKSPIVCVSIHIPMNAWNRAYPMPWGSAEPVVLTIHKPIVIDGSQEKEALKKQCFDTIYSVLPDARKND